MFQEEEMRVIVSLPLNEAHKLAKLCFWLRGKGPQRRRESGNLFRIKRLSDSDNQLKGNNVIVIFLCGPVPNDPRTGTGPRTSGWGTLF